MRLLSFHEPIETIARALRFREGWKQVLQKDLGRVVDVGCGPNYPFYRFVCSGGGHLDHYLGIDPLVKPLESPGITLRAKTDQDLSTLAPNSVDMVVSFASLEHMESPSRFIRLAWRVLRQGGRLLLTTPTPLARYPLEVLAKLRLVSRREIEEHKHYFGKQELYNLFTKGFEGEKYFRHTYFLFWLNHLVVAEKRVAQ